MLPGAGQSPVEELIVAALGCLRALINTQMGMEALMSTRSSCTVMCSLLDVTTSKEISFWTLESLTSLTLYNNDGHRWVLENVVGEDMEASTSGGGGEGHRGLHTL